MICRGQLDQNLGGEREGWGLQENKLVLAIFLALALLLAGQLHSPARRPPFVLVTQKHSLHLRRATINSIATATITIARSRLRFEDTFGHCESDCATGSFV